MCLTANLHTTIRARAPLRLGLAGGGTDLSPYCDQFGGNVLNCTISRYAYATIERRDDESLFLIASDLDVREQISTASVLPVEQGLLLHRGVYNRMVREFNCGRPMSLNIHTSVDA